MYRTRDWRRAQRARIIRRVVEYKRLNPFSDYDLPNKAHSFVVWYDVKGNRRGFYSWQDIHEFRWQSAKHLADNRQKCSAYCCGNQRKWFKEITIQEKRLQITCKEVI